jgi:hypothetical protein
MSAAKCGGGRIGLSILPRISLRSSGLQSCQ